MIVDLAKRETPADYIKQALQLFTKNHLGLIGEIVEIGCVRQPVAHDPTDGSTCPGCSDGHTTAWIARSDLNFFSVDVNPAHCDIARQTIKKYEPTGLRGIVVESDGIEFLKSAPGMISMLILDAWDVDLPDSAEKHLEAIQTALPRMTERSIVVIDDTDVNYAGNGKYTSVKEGEIGGKGKLAVPFALANGYRLIRTGRMTILGRNL